MQAIENSDEKSEPKRAQVYASLARKSTILKSAVLPLSSGSNRRASFGSFFQAHSSAKAKQAVTKLLNEFEEETETPPQDAWDPEKESRLVYILKKEWKTRKDAEAINEDIQHFPFYNQFIKDNMTEFGDEGVLQLCGRMKYEFISKGNYVIREGDASNDKFYIILSGKVSVKLKKDFNVYAKQNIAELQRLQQIDSETGLLPIIESNESSSATQGQGGKFLNDKGGQSKINSQNTKSNKTSYSRILDEDEQEDEDDDVDPSQPVKTAVKKRCSLMPALSRHTPPEHIRNTKRTQTMAPGTTLGKNNLSPEIRKERQAAGLEINEHGTVNKVLEQGEAFGEKALTNPGVKRTASIYTVTDCEFIIVQKTDFLSIVNRFNKTNRTKVEFILANIPNLDKVNSRHILEDYMYSVHIAESLKGHKITEQGVEGQRLYLLSKGFCILQKEVEVPNPEPEKYMLVKPKTVVQVARVGPGTMIGEELLFGGKKNGRYHYTAIVDSENAFIYYMKASEVQLKFPRDTILGLKANFEQKEAFHKQRIDFVLEKRQKTDPNFSMPTNSPSVKDFCKHLSPAARNRNIVHSLEETGFKQVVEKLDGRGMSDLRSHVAKFSRDGLTVQTELQKRKNPTLNRFYEHTRGLKQRQEKLNQTASPILFHEEEERLSKDKNDSIQQSRKFFELTNTNLYSEEKQFNTPARVIEDRRSYSPKGKASTLVLSDSILLDDQSVPQSPLLRLERASSQKEPQTASILIIDSEAKKHKTMSSSSPAHSFGSIPFKIQSMDFDYATPKTASTDLRSTIKTALSTQKKLKKIISLTAKSPSKRGFVIRQKEGFESASELLESKGNLRQKLRTVSLESPKGASLNGISKFDFGDSRGLKPLERRKLEVLQRYPDYEKEFEASPKVHRSEELTGSPKNANPVLNVLKIIVSPNKEGLYNDLAKSLSKKPSNPQKSELELSLQNSNSPPNVNSLEASTQSPTYSSPKKQAPLTETKWSYSGLISSPKSNRVTYSTAHSDSVLKLDFPAGNESPPQIKLFSGSEVKALRRQKTGNRELNLSLHIKKNLYQSLRAKKTKSSWKDALPSLESSTNLAQGGGTLDIVAIRPAKFSQNRDHQGREI